MGMRRLNGDGFTLVELLVVMGIIGILAGLVLSGVLSGKAKAQRVQCLSNVRELGLGMQLFVTDNHAFPLGVTGPPEDSVHEQHDWRSDLEKEFPRLPLTQANNVWHCPSFHAPPSHDERIAYGWNAYGYNAFGLESSFDDTFGLGGHKITRASENSPVRESEVLNPSDMMALGDGLVGGYFPQLYINDGSRFLKRIPIVTERGGAREPYNDRTGSTQRAKRRHQGKANVFFCDGHAESPALIFLFQATNDAALVRWNRDHLPHPDRLWQKE
jgi:prepilin-type N-terminal cleavage/methylation domain-containing protein/prepilin-type processing-associated H-X9-DG protein